jgi:hypothetical protein
MEKHMDPISDNDEGLRDAPVIYRWTPPAPELRADGSRADYSDQTPEEYAVQRWGEGRAQIITYGKYRGKWMANASERGLVEHLLARLAAAEGKAATLTKFLRFIGWTQEYAIDVMNGKGGLLAPEDFPTLVDVWVLLPVASPAGEGAKNA